RLPAHLRVSFAVEDASGAVVARGKDLPALQAELSAPAQAAVAAAVAGELERSNLLTWPEDLPELPRLVERTSGDHTVRGYPALVDAGASVAVRVFTSSGEQDAAMRNGVRRLLRLAMPSPVKAVERTLSTRARLLLGANPDGTLADLLEDCADAAVDDLVGSERPWDRPAFDALRTAVAAELIPRTAAVTVLVEQ